MIGVVFWRIEISIHPPFRAEREQPPPVCHRPQRTEKTFDDTSAMKSFGGVHAALISHSNAGGTRLRSLNNSRLQAEGFRICRVEAYSGSRHSGGSQALSSPGYRFSTV